MVAAVTGVPAQSRRRPHCSPAASRRYERRRPEKTPLHKIISENLESWLEWRDAERPVPGYVEEELRGYLECGMLCFGFARDIQPALGRHLGPVLRHQHHRVRHDLGRDPDHLGRGRHLQVQPHLDQPPQQLDIPILDVPAVLAQVDGDPVRLAQLGLMGRPDGIRLPEVGAEAAVAGLPNGRDVIVVDTELHHVGIMPRRDTVGGRSLFFQTYLDIVQLLAIFAM